MSTADGNPEIYVINSNGTGSTRLALQPASDVKPVWSPDGTKIAFQSHPPLKHHPTRARRGDQIAVPRRLGCICGHGAVRSVALDELAVDLQYLVGVTGEPCMRVALTGSVAHQSPRGGIAEHRRQSCPDAMIVFPEGATMANRVSLANFAIAHARRTVSSALSSSGLAPKGTARRQRKRG